MQQTAETPLALTDPTLLEEPPRTTWIERVPLFGQFVWWHRVTDRHERATAEVDALLRQRTHFPVSAWQEAGVDPAFAESVAISISRLVVRQHPNHFYRPDDPIRLLLIDPEGMAWFDACMAIEKRFGHRIDIRPLLTARLVDLVSAIPKATEVLEYATPRIVPNRWRYFVAGIVLAELLSVVLLFVLLSGGPILPFTTLYAPLAAVFEMTGSDQVLYLSLFAGGPLLYGVYAWLLALPNRWRNLSIAVAVHLICFAITLWQRDVFGLL